MAEVFKAKSYGVEGFEKIIAIKRILPTMGEDRDFIKMFIDEAKIAGQLTHANICQIFELGRIDGSHFIAMEYIWGKDLLQIQNRLRKNKQDLPIDVACFVLTKVLEGLDYAHRKHDALGRPLEIVHRDCSPQNVLVSYEGEVKIIDFGIAKATSRNSRTMAGVLKGKFGYMSPEQVRGLPLDRRSDIFALGTMLYECLTGARLFHGETDFATLEKVRNVDIQPPRTVNPAIPEAVEKVILKALAKDVDDRYQWCSEMLSDLQAYLMAQEVVFTAKSLSTWFKDVFQAEIEREREQHEMYKLMGRDGLIGGLPSVDANKDVTGQLGEAGAPEGDPTTLGPPNFDDVEDAFAAFASMSSGDSNVTPAPPAGAPRGDFVEEAPTDLFNERHRSVLAQASAAGIAPAAASARPSTIPPKPPPGARPVESFTLPMQPQVAHPGAGRPDTGVPAKTVLGVQAPTPLALAQYLQQNPQHGTSATGYPSYPSTQGYPAYPMPQAVGYPPGAVGYGYPPGAGPLSPRITGPVPLVNPVAQAEGKRSTPLRDIFIGVVIAAVVLGGFFAVKTFFLDDERDSSATTRTIATVRISMTAGVAADMFIDDKRIAVVTNNQDVPVSAGNRRVVLVGPNGATCDKQVMFEPGRTVTLKCEMPKPGAPTATSAPGSAVRSEPTPPAPTVPGGSGSS